MADEKCEKISKIVKKIIGWHFVEMITRDFPVLTIVLEKAGPDESDLKLSINRLWVEKNNIQNIYQDNKERAFLVEHHNKCQSPKCLEASSIRKEIGLGILEYLVCSLIPSVPLSLTTQLNFSRKTTSASIFNRLLLVFDLFSGENKNLWVWPEEATEPAEKEEL